MTKVYLVGAGPGDPGLLTIKGLKAIEKADVILYDRLVNKELLSYAKKDVELVYCGKLPGKHALIQENINYLLCKYALENKIVTRLKGGDPFIFGRGGEEAEVLHRHNISYEIVPGITSGSAAPAYAGIPLTHRNISSSVTFISGYNPEKDSDEYWKSLVRSVETLCIYMGIKRFPDLCERLVKSGMCENTPIAIIHWGTNKNQKTITGTLSNIGNQLHEVANPSMIIIGEVVRLREKLQWFEEQLATNQLASKAI
ncbi:uroporphyrinogen-III C-methyltransferase [Aquibacillus koreensis]|uniref:Uroporphyrinogen-III C-methyltransferase n=1 Tax=Aquibacillus koreensis TaxID=279446 RepID=A0A9X4AKZ3_9BACI|nr:uroporphyrinogen-III C-methyltransferase [Aquibacillus koreensis]MCT2536924.1 uroporphyrinogen-III C-methyltransferase [Aquibacillus koreensis]MDC3421945.1 uroporphyrinogen-III C-methyltransferase [Aquibacillus koreensis]